MQSLPTGKKPHKGERYNKANAIFQYLSRVAEEDGIVPTSTAQHKSVSPGEGTMSSVDTRYIPESKPSLSTTIPYSTPHPLLKRAAESAPSKGWGWGKVDDFMRSMTGTPILRSLLRGGLTGGAYYLAAPWISKWFSKDEKGKAYPVDFDRDTGDPLYITPKDRRNNALMVGGLTALLSTVSQYNTQDPTTLWRYPAKKTLAKRGSMLGPVEFIPMGMVQQAVMTNPDMTMGMKDKALTMLGAIPGGPSTPINSTDLVSAAVGTGVSGQTGMPIARLTAAATVDYLTGLGIGKLVGMRDPNKLGMVTGAASLGLRALNNLF